MKRRLLLLTICFILAAIVAVPVTAASDAVVPTVSVPAYASNSRGDLPPDEVHITIPSGDYVIPELAADEIWVGHVAMNRDEYYAITQRAIAEFNAHLPEAQALYAANKNTDPPPPPVDEWYTVDSKGELVPYGSILPAIWITGVRGPYYANVYDVPETIHHIYHDGTFWYDGTLREYYVGLDLINDNWYFYSMYEGWVYQRGPLTP